MSWFKREKEKTEFAKMVAVYLCVEKKSILVTPFFINDSWVYHEQEEIETLDYDISDENFGEAIKRNLDKFRVKEDDLTKRKLTDWPSYKASGLKTVKEFEKKYLRISISGANEANLILDLDADMKSKYEINLRTTISAYAKCEEIGFRLRKLHIAQLERKIE